jgi:hypothetical protein
VSSHFAAIGFPVASGDDFIALAEEAGAIATPVPATLGDYLRWSPTTGEELWLQVTPDHRVVGMNPHFRGRSSMRVQLEARVPRADHTALDGAFRAWAMPEGDDEAARLFPFVFDAPDADVHAALALPATALVQLAGFAHEVVGFPSAEAFAASPRGATFASRAFIPAGLFGADGEELAEPRAYAVVIGHVQESATLENQLTHRPYHWALLDTYGGAMDVVADPAVLGEMPKPGGVVMGSFWLSGRILGGDG